ncbi:hypothetical protein [Hyalangium rubrum]|uniref:Uncharacterized protein n=1 Tax=Hyalangium rubrum TaxID=3103134 RepID=A0ABU5H439_9BACT|nr:hypothetical protein [Hyalangium sp. s54d21]MDY7227887.1 hypothetical protein [Hyalangium sp. s54d21]
MRKLYVVLTLVLTSIASNAYAVDPALVNNTWWSVGVLRDATMTKDSPHPTPWVFQLDGTVRAGGFWTGTWVSYPNQNKVWVTIKTSSGATDSFDVTFLTSNWFVATQNDQLYRYGDRL